MPLPEPSLSPGEADTLREAARRSIHHGLKHHGRRMRIDPGKYPPALQAIRACFVTLHVGGDLRGCIGSLQALHSLIECAVWNAHNAAFNDPRFAPVTPEEFPGLELSISVLGEEERISARDEADLLRRIHPGVDGITLRAGPHVATLLPAVWESIHSPAEFIRLLKRKAGLDPGDWPGDLAFYRYDTEAY